jgi:hypothetical protein
VSADVSRTLPFDDFLELLRGKGHQVGVQQYLFLGRILDRFDQTNAGELGDAIAALIGRNEKDVATIRNLFDEVYTPIVVPEPPPPPDVGEVSRHPWWRTHMLLVATVVTALLLLAVVSRIDWRPATPQQKPQVSTTPPPPPPDADAIAQPEPPTPPLLPNPPSRVVLRAVVQVGIACFVIGLLWPWATKSRAVRRRWLREGWRTVLGDLPGPYQFTAQVRKLRPRLPHIDVVDAAVMLGRIFSVNTRSRELNVEESLRLTISRGMVPHIVYKHVRTGRPIVVMQDVCYDMAPWRHEVEILLVDLRRQGIVLERWYFDGDPRRLSDEPRGAWVSIANAVGRRPDSPIMVISTGAGLAALDETDNLWKRTLESCQRRTWISPIADSRLWPDELSRVPMNVWPMTPLGLTLASRELMGIQNAEMIRTQALAESHVRHDDIDRVKRLASLVPYPSTDLLEFLRQRFAPDIPEAVIAHVARHADAKGLLTIRLQDAEVKRHAAAVRFETPRLEASVRKELVTVLEESEPPKQSAAHLRWRLSVALQKLSLAELNRERPDEPLRVLQELRQGPLWEEVQSAARLVPEFSGPAAASMTSLKQGKEPPEDNGELAGRLRLPRTWPGPKEIVSGAAAALLMLLAARSFGAFPTSTLAHVENAYELSLASATPTTQLDLRRVDAATPSVVDLFQGETLLQSAIEIPNSGTRRLEIKDGAGKYYQARATLQPGGNLAVSNQLWVPDPNLVTVVIDTQPWARFTIVQGEAVVIKPQQTPARVALRPGTYRIQLEYRNLTPAIEQEIKVERDNQRIPIKPMQGFDPDDTARTLIGK